MNATMLEEIWRIVLLTRKSEILKMKKKKKRKKKKSPLSSKNITNCELWLSAERLVLESYKVPGSSPAMNHC